MMPNNYFSFKQFTINQEKSAFKVGTDGVLLGAYADISNADSILDIGSGSGLVTLMLAQRSNAYITAIEPDPDSYMQTRENAANSPWHERIEAINTDLQNFNPVTGKYDLIVSNPPYFKDSLKNPDPRKSAARHNDSLSSDELLKGVVRILNDNGRFQVILPYVEGNILIAEANLYGLYCNDILKIRPLPGAEIRRLILTFTRERKIPAEKFLTIEHGRHEYTDDYINLTKDFYLKF
jgi:tRNA1Val (adenine37-N6)-methyltransferase